jgi:hypothetical protein
VQDPGHATPGDMLKVAQKAQSDANSASLVPEPPGTVATPAPRQQSGKKKRGPYRHKGFRRLAPWEQRRKARRERQRREKAKLNRKTGRPSAYKAEFAEQGFKLGSVGLSDTEIMAFLEISPPTFYSWTKKHPQFLNEIQRGRMIAAAQVAYALFRRAIGYSHRAVHIAICKNGQVVKVPYTKHYPPDVRACMFWLTNRVPEFWKARVEQTLQAPQGEPTAPLIICFSGEEMLQPKAALPAPFPAQNIAAPHEASLPALPVQAQSVELPQPKQSERLSTGDACSAAGVGHFLPDRPPGIGDGNLFVKKIQQKKYNRVTS